MHLRLESGADTIPEKGTPHTISGAGSKQSSKVWGLVTKGSRFHFSWPVVVSVVVKFADIDSKVSV